MKQALYVMADEVRGMASQVKYFADNPYDDERAHRMMKLAAKIAALADDDPPEEVEATFLAEPWWRFSPAIGVDAAVFNGDGEILLIQRRDNGRWAMPGGLAEIGETLSEAVLRELWEEAGLRGRVTRLLGVFDGRLWGSRAKVHIINMVFQVECDDLSPQPGAEALDARFYARDQLPGVLHPGHEGRIAKCFEVLDGGTFIDPADFSQLDLSDHQRPG